MSDTDLTGSVAVVTGGAGGIGRAIVRRLAADGASVVVADINEESAKVAAKELAADGSSITGVGLDVTNGRQVEEVRDALLDQHGRVDVLVNNAGFPIDKRLPELDEEDWHRVVDVCMTGAFLCSRAFVVPMAEQGRGRIINTSSRAYLGNPGQANYSAAKAGILGLTRSVAKEFGRKGVTVNAVAPGLIDTPAVRAHPKWADIEARAQRETPVRRVGTPDDVANAVRFFADPESSFITGEVIHVAGGRSG